MKLSGGIVVAALLISIIAAVGIRRSSIDDLVPEKLLLAAVYDGRTPCQDIARQIQFAATEDCFKLKWRLNLYVDSATRRPATYQLLGTPFRNQKGREGKWIIEKGAAEFPDAIVYRLEPEGGPSLYLMKADENILYFLDQQKKLLVGNDNLSFTLNRTEPD